MHAVIFVTGLIIVESFLCIFSRISYKRAITDTLIISVSYLLFQLFRGVQ